MGKVFDVIGVENMIMDFAVQINRLPKTDGISRVFDYSWGCCGNAGSELRCFAVFVVSYAVVSGKQIPGKST